MANKIFVRGFDFGTTEQGVRDHCASAGNIESVEFFGKGSAVVTYATDSAAQDAISTLHKTTLPGNVRYIEVKLDEGAKEKGEGSKKRKGGGEPVNRAKVFIRGFDFDTTDEDLNAHFGTVGEITKITWLTKGSVVLTYGTTEAAAQAVTSLDKSTIPGKQRYMDVKIDDEGAKSSKAMKNGPDMAAMQAWFMTQMGMGGGKGKKKKKKAKGASGPDLPRERVSTVPVSGKVLMWNKNWGWIRPSSSPTHDKASKHDGKIYVHVNDLVGLESLEKDNEVSFHIYADENGLGAEEVELGP